MRFIKRASIFVAVLMLVLVVSPALGAWGAGWTTGSVIAAGTVTGLKNAQKNGATVKVTVAAYGTPLVNNAYTSSGNIPGIVFCGNPGANNNPAPGVNPVVFTANFTGNEFIDSTQIDKNGKAPFNAHAKPDQAVLNTVFNSAVLCPNPNWVIIDFVPQQFSGLLQGFDGSGNLLTQSVYDCQIPQSVLATLTYQQQSQYTCTERIDQRVN
jgi:hypothetical protein